MTDGRRPKRLRFDDPARGVDEELGFHLDQRTAELEAEGIDPDEARRRAEEEFGDLEFTRDYCVAEDRRAERRTVLTRLWRTAGDDLRSTTRSLVRRPASVAAPVAVLALGIALNALVFTVVRHVLLEPPAVNDPDHTYVLEERQDGGGLVRAAYPVVSAWREGASSFGVVAAYLDGAYPLITDAAPVHVEGAAVTRGFFSLLPEPFLVGRGFADAHHDTEAPATVALSETLWRRAFGARADLVGETVGINGVPHRVTGIVRAGATFPEGAELWVPIEPTYPGLTEIAGAKILVALGVLRDGVDPSSGERELAALSAGVSGGAPDARVTPLRERLVGDVDSALLLLQGAVLLVLLVACANAGGMLLTRAVGRRGELAVRISLGASRTRIGFGLAAEGILIGLVAGALGIALAWGLLPSVLRLVPSDFPRLDGVALDAGVALVAIGLAAATGLLTALPPVVGAARMRPAASLRDHATRASGSPWLQRVQDGFVVGQVALATVLTVGAGLLARSFLETVREDPGFDPSRISILEISLPQYRYPETPDRIAFARELLVEAQALPGAEAVALGRNLPVSGSNMTSPLAVEGLDGTTDAVQVAAVSAGYFDVMGIPVLDGTGFGTADREDGPPTLVIDRTLRGDGSLLDVGSRARSFFGNSGELRDVIGVVGAVRHGGLRTDAAPIAYEPFFQRGGASTFALLVRSTAPGTVVTTAMRDLLARLDSELPADRVSTMTGRLRESVSRPRFYTLGLSVFGILTVALSLAGCQAGLARRVAARRRELGLRMALGASARGMRRAVVRRGLILTAMGAAAGIAAALPASHVLESQLYGIGSTDPLTYVVLAAVLLGAGALAADAPARRAAALDPARVLREE